MGSNPVGFEGREWRGGFSGTSAILEMIEKGFRSKLELFFRSFEALRKVLKTLEDRKTFGESERGTCGQWWWK
jgi:hypothetical protein